MQKHQYVTTLLTGMVLGAALYAYAIPQGVAQPPPPAYLIVAGQTLDTTGLEPYYALARPVAQEAGLKIIARNNTVTQSQVLEGVWPYPGFVAIERFDSMQALRSFWYSQAYQQAIELRQGKVKLDFVVAIEGQQ